MKFNFSDCMDSFSCFVKKLLFIFITCTLCLAQEHKGTIKIEVNGFVSDEGMARILVFSRSEKASFPMDNTKALIKKVVRIINKKVVLEFGNLPYGEYAISVHHDRNNDGKVNTNLLGIPKEGLGCTNDAKGVFGPPSFDKAKIVLKSEYYYAKINMVN